MITSLHSSHVETVKALLGSRGAKQRHETGLYVVESLQNVKSILRNAADSIETLYYTQEGLEKLGQQDWSHVESIEVSPEVMNAMTDTVTPQGLLALARIPKIELSEIFAELVKTKSRLRIAYFWEIQDPGNAGTAIRAADAFDFDLILFSRNSVDIYSPKVVRSSAGSLWQKPLITEVDFPELLNLASSGGLQVYATTADGALTLSAAAEQAVKESSVWIFGNEARGVPTEIIVNPSIYKVSIPISDQVESLNLATAASVVMYAVNAAAK